MRERADGRLTNNSQGPEAKAHIGSPISRTLGEAFLAGFLDRVRAVNRDPCSTHVIESVTLYGSLADPDRQSVTNVDLITFTRRMPPRGRANGRAGASGRSSANARDGPPKTRCSPSGQGCTHYCWHAMTVSTSLS